MDIVIAILTVVGVYAVLLVALHMGEKRRRQKVLERWMNNKDNS
jgi:hypothetical protein